MIRGRPSNGASPGGPRSARSPSASRFPRPGALALCAIFFAACAGTTQEGRAASTGQAAKGAPSDTSGGGYADLSELLEPLRKENDLPALGAAIVTPEGLTALGVVGVRKYGDATPARFDDAFHLGSDTKAMTAVVVAKLVEQNKLHWTTTIRDAFSDIPDQNPAYANVTLDDMLAHRGGFAHGAESVSIDDLRRLGGSLRDRREAYARIVLHEPPALPPRTAYSYSNTGYVLAGLMAERASGVAWEDLVRQMLFVPLDMQGAGFGNMATPGQVDGLWPHEIKNGAPVPLDPRERSDNPLFLSPAGGVHVSMQGWARFITDVLRGFEGRGMILSGASYEHLHVPPFGGTYAYGWTMVERAWAGGFAYTHGGSNTLNFALAWVAPKRRFAVLVATNVGTDIAFRACDRAVRKLVERLALPPRLPLALNETLHAP